jgi:hypothetical protein
MNKHQHQQTGQLINRYLNKIALYVQTEIGGLVELSVILKL